MRRFIYIGQEFYYKSGTRMGSFLEVRGNRYERAGIGDIEIAVRDGDEVHARPANKKEMEAANAELARILGDRR